MDVILPITIVGSALEGARRGFRTGGWLNKIIHGEGTYELAEGLRYMEKLFETQDLDFADKALQMFGKVKTNDKKYIVAQALYCEAMCYAIKGKYGLAYDSLDRVNNIEIKKGVRLLGKTIIGTQKPEIIREIQGQTNSLRSDIRNLESNGNILLQEYKAKQISTASPSNRIEKNTDKSEFTKFVRDKLLEIENKILNLNNVPTQEIRQLRTTLEALQTILIRVDKSNKEIKDKIDGLEKIILQNLNQIHSNVTGLHDKINSIQETVQNGLEHINKKNGEIKNTIENSQNALKSNLTEKQRDIQRSLYHTQGQISTNKTIIIWVLCIVAVLLVIVLAAILFIFLKMNNLW